MAEDKLIFPIGFDLEKGVKEAAADSEKFLKRIASAIEKHPISVKLQLNKDGKFSATIKKERERVTRELTGLKKEMAEINRQWNALSASDRGGEVGSRLMARYRELTQEAKGYTSTLAAAVRQEDRLARQREKSAAAATKAAQKTREYNNELKSQDGYISRLIKRLAVYASFSAISGFLRNVRNVTAEFELQQVSLGAIIQDQQRANQLFSEIKSFALKSPIKILDLTKYVKQVAAYRIETDKLFDTTKRLADVSVGLGVDMGRLVLAYGQVKAASYLRASEIRQFTEAGIPMLELLAEKFTEIQGKAVSTEQVMEMVSKRAVSFSMVEEIFKNMTDAGGMFYNMQEKQGNTLFGMWSKLGDAAAVMYEEIGNTESVNKGIKSTIQLLTYLMRNWKAVANTAAWVVAPTALTGMFTKYALSTTRKQAADTAAAAAAERRKVAALQLSDAIDKGSVNDINAANATLRKAQADEVAAKKEATRWGLMKSGFKSIAKSFVTGLGIGVLSAAVTTLAYKLFEAWENAHKLEDSLNKIEAERITVTAQSVRNFERLANAAVQAADGSKIQKDALEELKRTYRDILPVEDLKIEKLRAMKGDYSALTAVVEEYIAAQQKQKMLDVVNEVYAPEINEMSSNLIKNLQSMGLDAGEAARFLTEFTKQGEIAGKNLREQIEDAITNADIKLTDEQIKQLLGTKSGWRKFLDSFLGSNTILTAGNSIYTKLLIDTATDVERLDKANRDLAEGLRSVNEQSAINTRELGKYAKEVKKSQDIMENFTPMRDGKPLDNSTYEYQVQTNSKQVLVWVDQIKRNLAEAGVEIKDEWIRINDNLSETDPAKWAALNMREIIKAVDGAKFPQLKNWLKQLQNEYENIRPSDGLVNAVNTRFKEIADSVGANMDLVHNYMMRAGQGTKDYAESIKASLEESKQSLNDLLLRKSQLNKGIGTGVLMPVTEDDIKNANTEVKFLTKLYEDLARVTFYTGSNHGGSDNRLQTLNKIEQTLTSINKKYEELVKKEGQTAALDYVKKNYESTLKYVNELGKKFGLKFEMPTDFKDLQTYRQSILDVIKQLRMNGFEEAAIALELKIADGSQEKLEQQIDKQLKELADKISRTKTAKEFYQKILDQTGDIELAAHVTLSIYGDTGEGLFDATVKQIQEIFKSNNPEIEIDLSSVIDLTNQRINYGALGKLYKQYQNVISEANRSTAEEIISEGEKTAAANILNWGKELAKAKDFEQQRTDIINRESQRRAEIIKSYEYTPEQKQQMVSLSYDKQAKDLSQLGVEEFKASEDYIRVFQDLDKVSSQTLERLKKRLEKVIATAKEAENIEGVKALVEALNKIQEEQEKRGDPLKGMIDSLRNYRDARKELRDAEANEAAVKAEFAQQEIALNADIAFAKSEQVAAQQRVNELQAQGLAGSDEMVAAELQLNAAKERTKKAEDSKEKASKEVLNAEERTNKAQDKATKSAKDFKNNADRAADTLNKAASLVQQITDLFEIAEDSELGDLINGFVSGLQTAATVLSVISAILTIIEAKAAPLLAVAVAAAAIMAIGSWISNKKVHRANKEIERQQKILDNLEYTYGRLEKAAEKAFGSDYINNFKSQQANLQAQITATERQLAAERSKGKKKDNDKIKEYEKSIHDLKDNLTDMQGELASHFLGTDLTSAAREFAQAWLDAYKEFGNTADAISEKFQEMIQNMVVEGALAAVMERALKPMFDMIDNMGDDDFYSEDFWREVATKAEQGAKDADYGAQTMMKFLEQSGISMRKLGGDLTGISRDIANTSEESINGLAATMNTWSYYVSHVPGIAANVAAMRAIMEENHNPIQSGPGVVDIVALQNQSLSHLQAINQHTAETVTECRRIAERCTAMAEDIHKVVVPKGSKGTHGVQVYM